MGNKITLITLVSVFAITVTACAGSAQAVLLPVSSTAPEELKGADSPREAEVEVTLDPASSLEDSTEASNMLDITYVIVDTGQTQCYNSSAEIA